MKVKITFEDSYVDKILDGSITDEVIVNKVRKLLEEKVEHLRRLKYVQNRKKVFKKEEYDRLSNKRRSSNREKELYQVAEEFRSDLIKNQTPAEKKFKALLKSLKIEYEFQKIIYTTTKFYIVDFYIPSSKIVFEIDGEYHDTKEQKSRDKERTEILKSNKIVELYRFTNKDVLDNIKYVTTRINKI
jgi:very-short-patch-repair endonuclease